MIGTTLNVAGILAGGIVGWAKRPSLARATENNLKIVLGVFTVYYGLRLTILSFGGSLLQVFRQVVIVVLAMVAGKAVGKLLRLQALSNHLGQDARELISAAKPGAPGRSSTGFRVCAAIFCASPLGIVGALTDGLSGYFYPLAIKAVMDGLATLGFVALFGRGVLLAALPVFALQGTLSLLGSQVLKPFLEARNLLDPVNGAAGMLVFTVALVVLGLRKVKLTEYLPSLVFAPLITWLCR